MNSATARVAGSASADIALTPPVTQDGAVGRLVDPGASTGSRESLVGRYKPPSAPRGIVAGWAAMMAAGALLACEPPQAPAVCGAIPQQTIVVGESVTVTACFDDPNGDMLGYKVWISDPGVATVTGSGATVTVTAVRPGNALVTILADNRHGLKAQQSFQVLVPNRPPVAVGEIADREVMVGDSATLDISDYFSEPDGQALSYTVASDSSVARASVTGAALTVVAVAKGTTAVTLTATDPGGLKATQSFRVTVPNRSPVAEGTVSAQTVEVGDTTTVDMSPFFSDPDGDALSYSAVTSDTTVTAVRVVDSVVLATAIAKGQATITVTATDTEGLAATQSFLVTVPNRAPVVADTIPAQTVEVGDAATVDMTPHFSDPDGDALTYMAVAGDPTVAVASVVEESVTVTAIAKGETTVTVTATDTEGLTVAQDFAVTVPNRGPVAVGSIPARTVQVDSVITLDITPYFRDPDGDTLVYAASTSDTTVARPVTTGATVTVSAVARGEATVTVTATDTEGLTATQSFAVTVPNRAPVVTNRFSARSIPRGETKTLILASFFTDPDGDSLTMAAVSSVPRVVATTIADGVLTLEGRARGSAKVKVTASDPEGLSAEQEFDVTVTRPPRPNRSPRVTRTISSRRVTPGQSFSADLNAHFSDPDGDRLRFEAASSDVDVATAAVSGRTLVVNATGVGNATVTVTAEDPDGESATIQFNVSVARTIGPNRAPTVRARIPDRNIAPGDSFSADLDDHFRDPDGDPLDFEAVSGDEMVAAAEVSGSDLTVTGVGDGTTTVTVTASDPGNRTASLTFGVTVEEHTGGNRSPRVTRVISFQTLDLDGTFEADLDSHFSDPDNDALSYSATSSNGAFATADVSGSDLTVAAVAAGTTAVTVTAEDPGGLTATLDFDVTVRPPPPPNRAPTVTSTPPDRFWVKNRALPFQGWRYFEDPDDDPLTYSGTSSNTTVATIAQQSDIVFEVQARSDGTATITATARDPDGLTVDASFEFEVGNNAPTVSDPLSGLTSSPNQLDSVIMNSTFEDSDGGDELSYSASSSAPAKATVSVLFSRVYGYYAAIRGVEVGEATVTMTARDLGGLTVDHSFVVTVESNRPPRIKRKFPGRVDLTVGDTTSFVLSQYFEDPDGDDLTYSGAVGFRASAHMSGDTLHLVGVIAGITVGEVTAEDTGGKSVSQRFTVLVQDSSSSDGIGPASGSPTGTGAIWGVPSALRHGLRPSLSLGTAPEVPITTCLEAPSFPHRPTAGDTEPPMQKNAKQKAEPTRTIHHTVSGSHSVDPSASCSWP